MKKILIGLFICPVHLFAATTMPTAGSPSLPATTVSTVTSNNSQSASPSTTSPANTPSSAISEFPLPEGVKTAPPLLSADLASAITGAIKPIFTIQFKNMLKEPLPEAKPAQAPQPIASFKPVSTPANLTSISSTTSSQKSTVGGGSSSSNSISTAENTAMPIIEMPKFFTGSFDITSRYVFRGISHNANNPAFQGDFIYTFLSTGIYVKVWGSNVDFLSRQGQQASVEADTIAGVKNKIGRDFTYNLSIVRYNYPKAAGANYNEFVTVLTYKILNFTLGYSSNAFNAHANGLYYNGGFNIPIPEKYTFQYANVAVLANYGHYNLSEEVGLRSYSDFMLGIQKDIKPYRLMLQWIGTNGEAHLKGLDANRLVASVFVYF